MVLFFFFFRYIYPSLVEAFRDYQFARERDHIHVREKTCIDKSFIYNDEHRLLSLPSSINSPTFIFSLKEPTELGKGMVNLIKELLGNIIIVVF